MNSSPVPVPSPNKTLRPRIPSSLQAVFLASNRGKEVHKPPPEQTASKIFFNNWSMQRRNTSLTSKTGPRRGLTRNSSHGSNRSLLSGSSHSQRKHGSNRSLTRGLSRGTSFLGASCRNLLRKTGSDRSNGSNRKLQAKKKHQPSKFVTPVRFHVGVLA